MNVMYKCPHCGKEIGEVEVVVLTWKRVLVSAGLGIGCGLLVYPLMHGSWVGIAGAFIVGFIISFLVWKEKK